MSENKNEIREREIRQNFENKVHGIPDFSNAKIAGKDPKTINDQTRKIRWRIVGFQHPTFARSRVYGQGLTTSEMLRKLTRGIDENCNLFSIRGFPIDR